MIFYSKNKVHGIDLKNHLIGMVDFIEKILVTRLLKNENYIWKIKG